MITDGMVCENTRTLSLESIRVEINTQARQRVQRGYEKYLKMTSIDSILSIRLNVTTFTQRRFYVSELDYFFLLCFEKNNN